MIRHVFSISLRRFSNEELLEVYQLYSRVIKEAIKKDKKLLDALVFKMTKMSLSIIKSELEKRSDMTKHRVLMIDTIIDRELNIKGDKDLEKFRKVLNSVSEQYHKEHRKDITIN